ncbi:LacI family DNA-binding transcriptional regulator [Deinococcus sonorensis]|uniref:Substrate-binding domain-containing protein n=1 Tax=Deinococcus sonorensis KR-87 TaxID=694439 RepID=A0AAU7UBZ9_9DEIO
MSPATVSNAYNRPDQLSAELRARILHTAQQLGYSGPDPLASNLRRGRARAMGVLYDAPLSYAFADPAASLFLGGVAAALQQEGLNLLLIPGTRDVAPSVASASVDGFIVYCAQDGSELLTSALGRGLPLVMVDQAQVPGIAHVGIDDYGGAHAAAAHLLELGHRSIGVVSLGLSERPQQGPVSLKRERQAGYYTTRERLRGYRDALGRRRARLHVYEALQNTPAEGEAQARALLSAHPEITALLCMSDVLAMGAWRAAQQLGYAVPQRLSLLGYDDLPVAATLGLTSVYQPTEDKGRLAGELLLEQLAGAPERQVRLPTELRVRASTAAPEAQSSG